jgi:hypothetical protein
MDDNTPLDAPTAWATIVVPKGAVIKRNGIPAKLLNDTEVELHSSIVPLFMEDIKIPEVLCPPGTTLLPARLVPLSANRSDH